MKPKHQRLWFISGSMVFLCLAVVLTLDAFKDNLMFFYTPSQLAGKSIKENEKIRIGGLVETGSIQEREEGRHIDFILTDGSVSLLISYQGILPNLFREGQGAVVEGYLQPDGHLKASRLMTKHDENYMPQEVVDELKRSGRWQHMQGKAP